jgi:lipopolysaccharide export system protein LptA
MLRAALIAVPLLLWAAQAQAQPIDLSSGGPITITASEGIEWHQAEQEVIARGNAKAVRGDVTVVADRLTAWYRKRAGATDKSAGGQTAKPADAGTVPGEPGPGDNEIYRVQAEGHVRIFTPTDQASCDRATYDLDQAVLLMTGHNLRLTTPNEVLTARDALEYWSQKHMAVARGDATVVTSDGKLLSADTLVAYTEPAPQPGGTQKTAGNDAAPGSSKLQRVEAFGNVVVRTATDTVTGERGVYVPDVGIARLAGHVRITRGQNQLDGAEAEVNLKTGVSRLLSSTGGRVQGLVVPNESTRQQMATPPGAPSDGAAPASETGKQR